MKRKFLCVFIACVVYAANMVGVIGLETSAERSDHFEEESVNEEDSINISSVDEVKEEMVSGVDVIEDESGIESEVDSLPLEESSDESVPDEVLGESSSEPIPGNGLDESEVDGAINKPDTEESQSDKEGDQAQEESSEKVENSILPTSEAEVDANVVIDPTYEGLMLIEGIWYYVENGDINVNFTGLTNYYGTVYYVEDGILDWNYTDLFLYEGTWYYVEGGIWKTTYTDLFYYYGTWYYIEDGILNWDFTGLTDYYGTIYFVQNGILNWDYTGLQRGGNGVMYYVENGSVNPRYGDTSKPTDTAEPDLLWNFFMDRLENPYAVAGLMGNLYLESYLRANNLQDSSNSYYGISDAEYTRRVDSGEYTNFIYDSDGYGLAQWTYWSRKQTLYNHAQDWNASIGNVVMQADCLYYEMQTTFSSVLRDLRNADSVREASDIVLTRLEGAANQSEAVKELRASYGMQFFNQYSGK